MGKVTISAHVLIFFTWPFQSHADKVQPNKSQSKGDFGLSFAKPM